MSSNLVNHGCSVTHGFLMLGSFHGGKHGRCVQLTTPKDYVQMTFKEAVDFFKTCIAEIEKLQDEYNRNPPWWEKLHKKELQQKMTEKVHITQLKCWSCAHLIKKGLGSHDYRCVRNKVIPEYLQPDFAVNCVDYKPIRKVVVKENQRK